MLQRSGCLLFCNANGHNGTTLLSNERNNSDAVIVFGLIRLCKSVSPNWSTKTANKVNVPFQGQLHFPKQMFTDAVFFLSSEASASAIKLFNAMTGECVCLMLSSLKAKCSVCPLRPCDSACGEHRKHHRCAWPCVMSF